MRYIKLLALLALCTSCGIKGKIIEDRYYDPSGWYSVEIPENKPKMRESIGDDGHVLTMTTGLGEKYKIEVAPCREFLLQNLKKKITSGQDNTLDMTIINLYCSGTRIAASTYCLRERGGVTLSDGSSAYFAIIEINEGSMFRSCLDAKTEYAACLLFLDNSKCVVLHYQSDALPQSCQTDKGMDYSMLKTLYLEKLTDFRKSYRCD